MNPQPASFLMSPNPRLFGKEIRARRKWRGWTLDELSVVTQLSKGVLSKIENGKGNPTLDTIGKLADAFGIRITIDIVYK